MKLRSPITRCPARSNRIERNGEFNACGVGVVTEPRLFSVTADRALWTIEKIRRGHLQRLLGFIADRVRLQSPKIDSGTHITSCGACSAPSRRGRHKAPEHVSCPPGHAHSIERSPGAEHGRAGGSRMLAHERS